MSRQTPDASLARFGPLRKGIIGLQSLTVPLFSELPATTEDRVPLRGMHALRKKCMINALGVEVMKPAVLADGRAYDQRQLRS